MAWMDDFHLLRRYNLLKIALQKKDSTFCTILRLEIWRYRFVQQVQRCALHVSFWIILFYYSITNPLVSQEVSAISFFGQKEPEECGWSPIRKTPITQTGVLHRKEWWENQIDSFNLRLFCEKSTCLIADALHAWKRWYMNWNGWDRKQVDCNTKLVDVTPDHRLSLWIS